MKIFYKNNCLFDSNDYMTIQNAIDYLEKKNLKPKLNCPNCGARLKDGKCSYCKSVLLEEEFKISSIKRVID